MQNVEIRQLDLSSKYKANLIKAQFTTAAEVLLTPPNILRQRTTLSPADVNQLIFQLSQAVLAREEASCQSIAEVMRDNDSARGGKISFGDAGLDQLFDGGVRVGSLTEIAGQSASGKTHLSLQLALNVQLPISQGGLSGGALFISSEGTLSTNRLLSLAAHMPLHSSSSASSHTNGDSTPRNHEYDQTVWDYLDNVHPEKAPDVDTLEAVVSYHAPTAIERINSLAKANKVDPNLVSLTTSSGENEPIASQFLSDNRTVPPRPPLPIRLVILDSIAAPLRAAHETGSSGFFNRAKELISIGDKLKRIAHVYNCAVVVINQVQDVFERTGPLPPHLLESVPLRPEPSETSPSRSTTPTASFLTMPRPPPPLPPPSRTSSHFPSPSLSRTSSTSTSSSSYSQYSNGSLPPPHVQYSLPWLLYTRFQSPFSTGACITPPSPYSPKVSAALGTTWTNLINTRVLCLISRRGGEPRRELNVVFGPEAKRGKVEYELREEGVRSVGEVELRGEAWMAEMDEEMREDGGEEDGEDTLWNQDWERAVVALEEGGEG